ncbi:MAG: hypothetical protein KI790_04075 [Cyclobacteriaceae bacterium]|nr:hypothetical protein [Cyclobacteriaceae bacterium HetDA_MAG_MS6]
MHPRGLFFLFLICGCNFRPKYDPIVVPHVSDDFYYSSIDQLEKKIEEQPGDTDFIKLQLTYFEQLDWPSSAGRAVRRAKKTLLDDPNFIKQCADFYRKNGRYIDLIMLSEDLKEVNSSPKWLRQYEIETLIEMNRKRSAAEQLRYYLLAWNAPEDDLFGALQYSKLGDTVLAIYQFEQSRESIPWHRSYLDVYAPILVQIDLLNVAEDVLRSQPHEIRSFKTDRLIAELYYRQENRKSAKAILKQHDEIESFWKLANWYRQERSWDSAIYQLNKILMRDSLNREAIMIQGDVNQERGFFTSALRSYYYLLQQDSTDTEAREQVDIVNRKIAYLRRIRESQREIPTLDLSKKDIE